MPITPDLHGQPLPIQLWDLTLIQLSNWRWSWRSMITTGALAPILSMTALAVFAQSSDSQAMSYIFIGNIVLAVMFENQNRVCNNFAFMRAMGTLNFFATLPIRRYSLVLATVLAFFLLSLPAQLATMLYGIYFLKISVHIHPLMLLVMPMMAAPLAGLGAWIGVRVRSPEEAGAFSLVATFIMLGLGPVLIPPDKLPAVMQYLGWFSPATYAASALRQVMIGPLSWRFALDLIALLGLTLVILGWVGRKMDWRQE